MGKRRSKKQETNYKSWSAKKRLEQEYLQYYYNQLEECFENEEEKQLFAEFVKKDLPACFRVNPFIANSNIIKEKIDKYYKDYQNEYVKDENPEKTKLEMHNVSWYPGGITYALNMDKNSLKKNEKLKAFYKFLNECNQCGYLYRQELVSMVPPLFLNIKEDDLVLDMCAAPGSKTTQILEFLQNNQPHMVTGGVIANELEYKRAWILSHQVKKINTPSVGIINHPGQFIPKLNRNGEEILFDKILADVPCSGDGAIRKLPDRWTAWNPLDGVHLHHVQVQLLVRAIKMLKEGGRCVYSTCSLNALENEAVVTEALRHFNQDQTVIELEDVCDKLKNFKIRKGMSKWTLQLYNESYIPSNQRNEEEPYEFESMYDQFESLTDFQSKITPEYKQYHKISSSMFPLPEQEMKQMHLERTGRILPHDNNSGGFYVAIIKKLKQTNDDVSEEEQKQEKKKVKQGGFYNTEEYERVSEELLNSLKEAFQLADDFPIDQLVAHVKSDKKISIVSKKIYDYLQADTKKKIQQIYSGTCVFVQTKQKYKDFPLWRLSNDGIKIIRPYLKSNVLKISSEFFLYLIQQGESIDFKTLPEDLPEKDVELIKKLSLGSYCLTTVDESKGIKEEEMIVVNKMQNSIVIMVSKEDLTGLRVKYLQ